MQPAVKKGYAEELQRERFVWDSLEREAFSLTRDYQAKIEASKRLNLLADFYQLLKKKIYHKEE